MVSSSSSSFSSSIFSFSSPNLSRRKLDVYHIQDAGLKRAARGSLKIQDAKITKYPPCGHCRTTLSGQIFAHEAHIANQKSLLNSNISLTRSHNTVNLGPLTAEIRSVVWGTPPNFNGFRALAALVHGTRAVSASRTLRR